MNETTLKPCPFCGGEPYIKRGSSKSPSVYYVSVKCGTCRGQGPAYRDKSGEPENDPTSTPYRLAINNWNRRAPSSTRDDEAEI